MRMTCKRWVAAGWMAAWMLIAWSGAFAADGLRPNILYILADDMGVGDVSALNPKCVWKSPNLDRLGAQAESVHAADGKVFVARFDEVGGAAWI